LNFAIIVGSVLRLLKPDMLTSTSQFRVLAFAVLLNLAWSFHPVLGKVLLSGWDPPHVAWLRYFSAWVFWILFLPLIRKISRSAALESSDAPASRLDFWIPLSIGIMTFFASPLLQISGLRLAAASDNAILIALEPLSAVLMALLVLRERPRKLEWISMLAAAFGVFVLSGGLQSGSEPSRPVPDASLIGNLLIITSLLGEGYFSAGGRLLVTGRSALGALGIFTRALSWGVLFLTFWVFFRHGAPDLTRFTPERILALLWMGPFGTALGYFIWLRLLEHASVSNLALTLFVQPMAGAALGMWILDEPLTISRLAGGALLLFSLLIPLAGTEIGKASAGRLKKLLSQ